nr:MAG TPA: hypothetical protein [Caudoviricetes sp.]
MVNVVIFTYTTNCNVDSAIAYSLKSRTRSCARKTFERFCKGAN